MYPGRHALVNPDKPAVIMAASGQTTTYRELDDRSNQLAQWLHVQGLRPGDHIAILAENHPRFFEVYWAALRSGLYLTAINRHLAPDEGAYLVNDSGSTVLITTNHMAATADAMVALIPDCTTRLMMDGTVDGYDSYEEAVGLMSATPLAEEPAGALMLYSSGPTGQPKGFRRELSGLGFDDDARARLSPLQRAYFGMDEHSVYLSPAPLYHAAPLG